MLRTTGGLRIVAAPVLLAFVALPAAGCDSRSSSSPSPTLALVASPSREPSARLPTPVPTVLASGSEPRESEPAPSGALLLRLTTCDDACGPTAGTTVLQDGRIIWGSADEVVVESHLTAAGLATIREAIDTTPPLAMHASYVATLKPGAEPIPHGVASHRFDVVHAASEAIVTSWDPDSLEDQRDSWLFPPEMETLDALASQLADPVAWLGQDAFEAGPRRYEPDRHLVVVDLFPDVGEAGEFAADVDDVEWPFGRPIEVAGDAIGPGEDGLPPRCLILSADDASAMRAAESAAGEDRDLQAWVAIVAYDWRRADGFVQVTTVQLLPHEQGACADLVVTPP